MSEFSLYDRMHRYGSLSETPDGVPDARFALPSTINWMRALAILVTDLELNFSSARVEYSGVKKRELKEREINSVCEQLLFALHQLSSVRALTTIENKADVARVGIVAWYYGVYGSASAMIAASNSAFPETHAATARLWDQQFASNQLALPPFDDRVSSLRSDDIEHDLAVVRARGVHSLTVIPASLQQAWGCHAEYLSGTATWEQWNVQERLRDSKEFKALGVDNFRTKAARSLRDSAYSRRSVAFLHEASRYRGKANYRDAIYLAYGKSVSSRLDGFVDDLATALAGFTAMAAAYVSQRIGEDIWQAFLADLEQKRSISISPLDEWS